MSPAIDRLRERRLRAWQEASELAASAGGRAFSLAQAKKWDRLFAEIDSLDLQLAACGKLALAPRRHELAVQPNYHRSPPPFTEAGCWQLMP